MMAEMGRQARSIWAMPGIALPKQGVQGWAIETVKQQRNAKMKRLSCCSSCLAGCGLGFGCFPNIPFPF